MTDDLAGLLARAEQLEQENESLRAGQSPRGDDLDLRCENALLRCELRKLTGHGDQAEPGHPAPAGGAPRGASDDPPAVPRTLAEFSSLSPQSRRELANTMTRDQRDELLGRARSRDNERNYL